MKPEERCVYFHKLPDGSIFYIGSGTIERAYCTTQRSDTYKKLLGSNKPKIQIFIRYLTKIQSLEIERQQVLIHNPKANLVVPSTPNDVKYDIFSELFEYDPNLPTKIKCKTDFGWNGRYFTHKAGQPVGSLGGRYNTLTFRNKQYKISRVVWALHHGDFDSSMIVDHINGNRLDDRIENLRLVSARTNNLNRKKSNRNKSGFTGVYYKNCNSSGPIFIATWQDVSGKKNRKQFSVKKYGYQGAKKLAIKKRLEAVEQLRNQGLDYTDRHVNG